MNQNHPFSPRNLLGPLHRLIECPPAQQEAGPVSLRGIDLRRRRLLRHHYSGLHPEEGCGVGHPLSVVPRGGGDYPVPPLRRREGRKLDVGAPLLERAGLLKVLKLQVELRRSQLAERPRPIERRLPHDTLEYPPRFFDIAQRHLAHAGLPPSANGSPRFHSALPYFSSCSILAISSSPVDGWLASRRHPPNSSRMAFISRWNASYVIQVFAIFAGWLLTYLFSATSPRGVVSLSTSSRSALARRVPWQRRPLFEM